MDRSVFTKQLLDRYYQSFSKNQDWEAVISDDFRFTGGDMTKTEPVIGKQAYIDIIKRFSHLVQHMHVKQIIVNGDSACVIEHYGYLFPNDKQINGDVAAIWKSKDDKLYSLNIFFDTATFKFNTP